MAGQLMGPWQRALDSNGNPVSGAKAYFYTSGTTNPLNTYTAPDLAVAHTNPVVSDSAGWFPLIWGDAGNVYRVDVKDASGVALNGDTPYDNISPLGAGTAVVPAVYTGNTSLSIADQNRRVSGTGSWTLTLPLGSGLPSGWAFRFINEGSGVITAVPSGADTLDGGLSRTIAAGEIVEFTWTGSAFKSDNLSSGVGKHELWIPCDAMVARVTTGPGSTVDESTTNKVVLRTYDFDKDTPEFVQFRIPMPKSWNRGTITFKPYWLHGSTTTNFKVSWGLQAAAISNGDATDAAFGTAQYSNHTGGTTGALYIGPESGAITVGGSPAEGDLIVAQVLRKADDATNDTLAISARLIGVKLILTTSTATDA